MNIARYDIIVRFPSFPYGFGARKSWFGKAEASGALIAITPTLALLWQALHASGRWGYAASKRSPSLALAAASSTSSGSFPGVAVVPPVLYYRHSRVV